MNARPEPRLDPQLDKARRLAARMLGAEPRRLRRIGGGGNNRLYLVRTDGGARYALKLYFEDPDDPRDRIGAEFGALGFLARHDIEAAPKAIARDPDGAGAIYEWIDGTDLAADDARAVPAMIAFLRALHEAAMDGDAARLPLAAEACLSGAELDRQLRARFAALSGIDDAALGNFLRGPFLSALKDLIGRAEERYGKAGWSWQAMLPRPRQCLSPSDFGLHNALRRPDGRICFLDFEYFGWDDPVKLVSDVVWHPAMRLDASAKRRFVSGAATLYRDDPDFLSRLAALFPLYGLRWALIVLGPYLPNRWRRRQFADIAGADSQRAAFLAQRLERARALVQRAHDNHGGWIDDA